MNRETLIDRAIQVYRTIPDWPGVPYLSREDCLYMVGMSRVDAANPHIKDAFDRKLRGIDQRFGPPVFENNLKVNVDRALYLAERIVMHPETEAPPFMTYFMECAGFPKKERSAGAAYMRVKRKLDKLRGQAVAATAVAPVAPMLQPQVPPNLLPPRPPPAAQAQIPARRVETESASAAVSLPPTQQPVINVEFDNSSVTSQSMVSPITTQDRSFVNFEQEPEEYSFFNTPPVFGKEGLGVLFDETCGGNFSAEAVTANTSGSDSTASSNMSWREARKPQGSVSSRITHLTTSKASRKTSQAVQVERQNTKEVDNIRKSLYKAATVLWKSVKDKQNTLTVFSTPENIAEVLNKISGFSLLSGREIADAVDEKKVNASPPRLGRQGEIPLEEFKLFAHAVFTVCAIEQANCKDRTNREQFKTMSGEVLNAKRKADGLPEMNDARFYGRIEMEIAHLTDLTKADPRESLRVLWLTHQSQLKHYINWEKHAVELGFARELTDDERPSEDGYIVWKEHRLANVLQFDEMNVALDGTDSSIGGRQSLIPSARRGGVNEGGQAAEKSGHSLTIMFGINFAGEALPPLFIFPTAAANTSNYKLKADFAANLPQLKAQYGFNSVRHHNIPFAMNPKGGMKADVFYEFFDKCVLPLYPKCADNPEECLLVKTDSGPGRMNAKTLQKLRSVGCHLYPGMPNGTSIGQELDQMFSYLKKLVYKNRNDLWAARFRVEGESAALSMGDMSIIVFGGNVTLTDGTSIVLPNAFAEAMDADHIHKAMDKCGHCPSTRAALSHSQIRHEVVEGDDGDIDSVADPHGALLDELELQNRRTCNALIDAGYTLADKFRRRVKRVTENQARGRASTITEPNTKERQDALMGCATAGNWFHLTNGGGPMTCDDALIACARKDVDAQIKEMEKERGRLTAYQSITEAAQAVLAEGKDCSKWKKPQLQAMIQWKQGPTPREPNDEKVAANKPVLLELWKDKYEALPAPAVAQWTEEDEDKLDRMRGGGDGEDFDEFVGLNRCKETEDDYLRLRLLSFDKQRRQKILLPVMQEIAVDELATLTSKARAEDESSDEEI